MKSPHFGINVEIGGNRRSSSQDIPLVDARTCRTTFVGPHPTYPQVVKCLQNKVAADKAKGDYESNPTTKLFLDTANVALKPGGKQGKKKFHTLVNPHSFPVPFVMNDRGNPTDTWVDTMSRLYDNPNFAQLVEETNVLVKLPLLETIPPDLAPLFYPFRKRFSTSHHNNGAHLKSLRLGITYSYGGIQ